MSHKKWIMILLALLLFTLLLFGMTTIIIDPYFHYHPPLAALKYPIYEERYQSDGILRNFDYDAVIIGSSMISNFKTSELDDLFDTNSVKVTFSAASLKELNNNLQRAFDANPNIKMVVMGIDGFRIMGHKDHMAYAEYPVYLTDDSLINDVQYLFNKQVLVTGSFRVLTHTLQGKETTNFDEYANFMQGRQFGKDSILRLYARPKKSDSTVSFSEDLEKRVTENIRQNVISLAEQHPDVQFYCFFPPVSAYYFDSVNQKGMLQAEFDAYKLVSELLLQQENIRLFSFFEELDMITDPENYMDAEHYHEGINSQILLWMEEGEHELTEVNYEKHFDDVCDFFKNFDYSVLF